MKSNDPQLDENQLNVILRRLTAIGVELHLEDNQLILNASANLLTERTLRRIRNHKEAIRSVMSLKQLLPLRALEPDPYDLFPIQIGSTLPLFCFPPVHGSGTIFRKLLPYLSPQITLLSLHTPGVNLDLTPASTIQDIAKSTVEKIISVHDNDDYYLLGYSMGGKVAFEAARQLLASGRRVKELIIIDTHFGDGIPWTDENFSPSWFWSLFFNVYFKFIPSEVIGNNDFWEASDVEKLRLIEKIAHSYSNTEFCKNLTPSKLDLTFKFFRSQCMAVQNYNPSLQNIDITYIEAEETSLTRESTKWSAVVSGKFEVIKVPGNHTSIFYSQEDLSVLGPKVDMILKKSLIEF